MEQFFEHSDLGLGALTFQKGPGTIHCWTGRIADTEILFSIILNTSELRSANLDFIRSVLQNCGSIFQKRSMRFRRRLVKALRSLDCSALHSLKRRFPPSSRNFCFMMRQNGALHFEICTLPVGEPFGLMVEFSGDTPTDVYGLSEAEEIEADME